jgi:hypothetical protein
LPTDAAFCQPLGVPQVLGMGIEIVLKFLDAATLRAAHSNQPCFG